LNKKQKIDLRREQLATLNRPRYSYSLRAKLFFGIMDCLAGKEINLSKAKLIEILASIPYRRWEIRQYVRMTCKYNKQKLVDKAWKIMEWGREAQDNEYRHLLVINEKMKQDGIKNAWYLFAPIPFLLVFFYKMMTWFMSLINIRRSFLFNAEFEDHAEHEYARLVKKHPEWENQTVSGKPVKEYGSFSCWADVFRRIGLDERDHMNTSFAFGSKPEGVVAYKGMPESEPEKL
jgi:demethoxyubiquinone hydroxylase (CLK1/Coq7/Cat5 family)